MAGIKVKLNRNLCSALGRRVKPSTAGVYGSAVASGPGQIVEGSRGGSDCVRSKKQRQRQWGLGGGGEVDTLENTGKRKLPTRY